MARPFWSGQVQISLVSFGVKLFPATEAKSDIRFHQISRKSGERVRHQKVSASDESPVEKVRRKKTWAVRPAPGRNRVNSPGPGAPTDARHSD